MSEKRIDLNPQKIFEYIKGIFPGAKKQKLKPKVIIQSLVDKFIWSTVEMKLGDMLIDSSFVDSKGNLSKFYDEVKKDIEKNGFSEEAGDRFMIDSQNRIKNGQHRYHILMDMYGPEYKVPCGKMKFPAWVLTQLMVFLELGRWLFIKAKALYTKED